MGGRLSWHNHWSSVHLGQARGRSGDWLVGVVIVIELVLVVVRAKFVFFPLGWRSCYLLVHDALSRSVGVRHLVEIGVSQRGFSELLSERGALGLLDGLDGFESLGLSLQERVVVCFIV